MNTNSAHSPEEGAEAFDLHQLNKATFGSRQLALEVLHLFQRQLEKMLTEIENAPDERSRSLAAHTLKGSALGVGALGVAAAAEELERLPGGPDELAAALARLSARVAEARFALAQLLA